MLSTNLDTKFSYVTHILILTSIDALNWGFLSLQVFLWISLDAAMSKLSFRARALDANKSLPVYHEEDVPDLPDIASVNRVVPQMPTGMEKEEETEHHLQRAISAQQIYGEAQRLIIPTPDAVLSDIPNKLPQKPVSMPKQLIHVQAFTLEDELPDYDCDEEDLEWLEKHNNKSTSLKISAIEFEKMADTLEKGCSARLDLFTINDALALIKKDEKLVTSIFTYWKEKRTKAKINLTPIVRTEKKDGSTLHDPYVAFRRRVEKMQTRKNRKNDEASYEKMLRLRRDLNRACLILEMVKLREEKKRNLLATTIKVLEARYSNKDFNGELLHQCYDLLKQRHYQNEQPLNNNHVKNHSASERVQTTMEEQRMKRAEMVEEARKRHKLLKQRSHLMGSGVSAASANDGDADQTQPPQTAQIVLVGLFDQKSYTNLRVVAATPPILTQLHHDEGPDGKFSFRRKKGVIYHAPRYDSMGNWPWTHPVEGGSAESQYCYCCTSVQKRRRCIGLARRRIGRGGRIYFDRAYSPYDSYLSEKLKNSDEELTSTSKIKDRVPPWPHFKSRIESSSSSDEEDTTTYTRPHRRMNPLLKSLKSNSNNDISNNDTFGRPTMYHSFSSQPTSRFRVHPYSNNKSTHSNNQSINNQVFLASLHKNVESQNWILRRAYKSRAHHVTSVNSPIRKPVVNHHLTVSPSRPASTAPSSAIYQLNFPITTATNATTNSQPTTTSNVNNNIKRKTSIAVTVVNQAILHTATVDSSTRPAQTMAITSQPIVSRTPLSLVQQPSYIAQKITPQQNTVQMNSLQVQSVNSVRGNKLSISKGLTITHTPVASNGITTTAVPSVQLAR